MSNKRTQPRKASGSSRVGLMGLPLVLLITACAGNFPRESVRFHQPQQAYEAESAPHRADDPAATSSTADTETKSAQASPSRLAGLASPRPRGNAPSTTSRSHDRTEVTLAGETIDRSDSLNAQAQQVSYRQSTLRDAAGAQHGGVSTSPQQVPPQATAGWENSSAQQAVSRKQSSRREADGVSSDRGSWRQEELVPRMEFPQEGVLPVPADASREELPAVPRLTLTDVLQSVEVAYPLIEAELQRAAEAEGRVVSALGNFDLLLDGQASTMPLGFYENFRGDLGVKQPTWGGGYVWGKYRLGRGDIQPWYQERVTNEGGEFKLGMEMPLLRNRDIDKRRGELFREQFGRQAIDPSIRMNLIGFRLAASNVYWSWLGAKRSFEIQRQLLKLAEDRARQIEELVRSGDSPPLTLVDNQRLIATRRTKLIESQQKALTAGVKLSLFLRDQEGNPLLPPLEANGRFPEHVLLPGQGVPIPQTPFDPSGGRNAIPESTRFSDRVPIPQLQAGLAGYFVQNAVARRPELQELGFLEQQLLVQLAEAENDLLPELSAVVEAGKDVGLPSSSKGDKTQFEVEAGLAGSLPVQRRTARGKARQTQAKLAQLRAKREFTVDKIEAEVREAYTNLGAAAQRIELAEQNLELARQSLEAFRFSFELGDIDVIILNIYEQAFADAQIEVVNARVDYFQAFAMLLAVQALDASIEPKGLILQAAAETDVPLDDLEELEGLPSP